MYHESARGVDEGMINVQYFIIIIIIIIIRVVRKSARIFKRD